MFAVSQNDSGKSDSAVVGAEPGCVFLLSIRDGVLLYDTTNSSIVMSKLFSQDIGFLALGGNVFSDGNPTSLNSSITGL